MGNYTFLATRVQDSTSTAHVPWKVFTDPTQTPQGTLALVELQVRMPHEQLTVGILAAAMGFSLAAISLLMQLSYLSTQ